MQDTNANEIPESSYLTTSYPASQLQELITTKSPKNNSAYWKKGIKELAHLPLVSNPRTITTYLLQHAYNGVLPWEQTRMQYHQSPDMPLM
jgi:hypothetical protein